MPKVVLLVFINAEICLEWFRNVPYTTPCTYKSKASSGSSSRIFPVFRLRHAWANFKGCCARGLEDLRKHQINRPTTMRLVISPATRTR